MQGPQDAGLTKGPSGLPSGSGWEEDGARRPGFGTLRLQPVILGPPPEGDDGNAWAADDIDPAELRPKPPVGAIAALVAVMLVLGTAGLAYFYLRDTGDQAAAPPPARAPQAGIVPAPPPREPAAQAAAPPEPPASPRIDMGRVAAELIPPTTDGLSPARKVQTILIRVENDREIPTGR